MTAQQDTLPQNIHKLLQLPVWLFGISFTLGSALLAIYLFEGRMDEIMICGFFYVALTSFINAVALGVLCVCAFLFKEHHREILTRAAILLINIPVAIFYMFIVFGDLQLF